MASQEVGVAQIGRTWQNTTNWIIAEIIYTAVSVLLCLVVIGFFLLLALVVIGTVFPIIAAVKANQGETWKYPMVISFLK